MNSLALRVLVSCLLAFAMAGVAQAADESKPKAGAEAGQEAWRRIVYVPYRAIKTILDDPRAAAVVPLQEYLRLLSGAASRSGPIAAVVSESHYSAKVERDFVRIQASLTVQSVEKGWSEVRVNFGEAAIGKITSENSRVLVRGAGRGMYSLLIPAAGTYKVDFELASRVRTSPDGHGFALDCPIAAITAFDLSIPEADAAIDVTPQAVLEPTESPKGETRIKSQLAATPRIAARWRPRVGAKPGMELLAGVRNVLVVTIGDGVVHTDAHLTYSVLRGELGQLRIALPKGDRILDVTSPQGALRSWKAQSEANRQLVIADLLAKATEQVTVDVHTERALSADAIEVAGLDEKGTAFGIHAVDAVRESGELVLARREGIDVAVESEKGLVRVDATDISAAPRKADSLFYKFYSPAIRLRVEARPIEPRIVVTHRAQVVFTDDDLRLIADLQYEVTRAGLFEIALKIPDGLVVDSVESAAMRAFHVDAATGRLTITLNERRQGLIPLVVKGHRNLSGAEEIALPLFEPLGTFREDGIVQAFVPEGVELAVDDSKLTGAHPESPENVTPPSGTRLAGNWSFHYRPIAVRAKTVRKPTRLSAQIGTTVTVRQESAAVVSRIDFEVENAAVDTFRLAVPEAVADKVQIRADNAEITVKQQSRDEKAVDGWVAWSVVLERKVTGRHRFVAKYDLTPTSLPSTKEAAADKADRTASADAKAGRAELAIFFPQALGLKNADQTDRVPLVRIEGEVAIQKDPSLAVAATAGGGDAEPIDVRELKQLDHGAYLAFRYEKQPVGLKLSLTKYRVQEVVETVVARALVEVVVGRDAGALYRCRYLIKSSQRQRLELDLPTGSNPLGVFVDGKPVRMESAPTSAKSDAWTAYFVNLVRAKASDEPLLLAVEFRRSISPAPFETFSRPLKLEFPRIGGAAGDRVVVQQLRAAIWVPEKYALVQTPEGFVSESRTRQSVKNLGVAANGPAPSELDGWIGGSRGAMVEFPIQGNGYVYSRLGPAESILVTWIDMPIYTLVISLAIAVMAWLLRGNRWEMLATFALTAALAAALAALIDRELVWHLLLAARFGLAALAVIWLIEAFRRASRPSTKHGRDSTRIPPGVVVPPPGIFEAIMAKER